MTMKKILPLMLALCMSAACLTACGDSDESSSKKTTEHYVVEEPVEEYVDDEQPDIEEEEEPEEEIQEEEIVESEDESSEEEIPETEEAPADENRDPRLVQMESEELQYSSRNDEWTYNVYESYVDLRWYIGEPVEELIVPSVIDGLPVLAVGTSGNGIPGAINEVTTSIVFPDGLLRLNPFAFFAYEALENIDLPDSLLEIGLYAFDDCKSLKSIKIPGGVAVISSFAECESLEKVELSEGLIEISGAFTNCDSLKNITLPKSVKQIDSGSFYGINKLELTVLNPECIILDDIYANYTKIYGYKGSTAEKFAEKHSFISFIAID